MVSIWSKFVFQALLILYPNATLSEFAKATKTSRAAKLYWRPLNLKRSLPVLKWTSESEYFERLQTCSIYISMHANNSAGKPSVARPCWGACVGNMIQMVQNMLNYPPRACAARGYVIGRGVYIYCKSALFFWNQSFISHNTHFQRSILTQIGFSSNLMASGIA